MVYSEEGDVELVTDNATENLVLKLHISGKLYNNLWYNCNSYMQEEVGRGARQNKEKKLKSS